MLEIIADRLLAQISVAYTFARTFSEYTCTFRVPKRLQSTAVLIIFKKIKSSLSANGTYQQSMR